MIARLRGEVVEIGAGFLVIDVQGVGYRVFVPDSTARRLPRVGEAAVLHVHTHVREDQIALYGFLTRSELRLFETVVGVAGIGPKLALSILSHVTPEQFAEAVLSGDDRRLTKIPGIGKKTAARVLLELKDKLDAAWEPGDAARREPHPAGPPGAAGTADDAVAALVALGYSEEEARAAVREAARALEESSPTLEQVIRASLRLLDRTG